MANQIKYEIDVAALENLALVGIRRAAVFMGLGLNAAQRDDFMDYELSKVPVPAGTNHTPIVLVAPGADEKTIKEYKGHFAEWVIASGLAEVLEYYGLFLAQMHRHALVIYKCRGLGKDIGDFAEAQRNFEQNPGIKSKLDTLASRFGITTEHAESIAQLYRLRNAITHNFRTIGDKQVDDVGELVVRWHAVEMFAEDAVTKKMTPMRELIGKRVANETKVLVEKVRREHRFKKGDAVHLGREQLEEICLFFYQWCIPSMRDAFITFMRKHDVGGAS